MNNKISVQISPIPMKYYNKFSSQNYTLCDIKFTLTCAGQEHKFGSESSNKAIEKLISELDDYLCGRIGADRELTFTIPYIVGGDEVYPYSFKINVAENTWTFCYKRNPYAEEYDFVCDLGRDSLLFLREQVEEQDAKIGWESLGLTQLYKFDFPDTEYEWCYSAKDFCKALNKLCVGESIRAIYVSALNYSGPLTVETNFVNYYVGDQVIIQLDDILLDMRIMAEGLVKWRAFEKSEYGINGPTLKFIDDSDNEFCDIENVYDRFKFKYTDARIQRVTVSEIDSWSWTPKGFDKNKLGDSIELPKEIQFSLANNCSLYMGGYDDDFYIGISKAERLR